MGKRGPKPKPTAILKARGSRWANRPDEPQPEHMGRPPMPGWLRSTAKNLWLRLMPELEAMGVVAVVDQTALATYCQAWSKLIEAEKALVANGSTYTTVDMAGNTIYRDRPEVNRAIKLADQLLKLGREFGLTPASRPEIHVAKQVVAGEQPDKSRFFKVG